MLFAGGNEGQSEDLVGVNNVKQPICSLTVSGGMCVCVCTVCVHGCVISCQVRRQASRCVRVSQ